MPIRAYLKTAFISSAGPWTVMLLLPAPIVFAVVEDHRPWLWAWLTASIRGAIHSSPGET